MIASLNEGEFTVAIGRDALVVASDNVEAAFSIESDTDPIVFEGVKSEELPLLSGAGFNRDTTFVEFLTRRGGLRYLITKEGRAATIMPPASTWMDLPMMGTLMAVMGDADVCWCDTCGNMGVSGVYTSAAIAPSLSVTAPGYNAITVKASVLEAIIKASAWRKYCLFADRLFLKREGEILSISCYTESTALDPSDMIDFCMAYRRIGSVSLSGGLSFYNSDILRVRWEKGEGIMDVYGRVVGRFTCDVAEDFDVSIADTRGIETILSLRKFTIYVPNEPNQPVGFRSGDTWFWTMSLP